MLINESALELLILLLSLPRLMGLCLKNGRIPIEIAGEIRYEGRCFSNVQSSRSLFVMSYSSYNHAGRRLDTVSRCKRALPGVQGHQFQVKKSIGLLTSAKHLAQA